MDLTQAIAMLLSLVPERHRHTVSVVLLWLGLAQLVVSQIVAQLPVAAAKHPRWGWLVRALHAFGHARLKDEPGTVKLPGQGLAGPPRAPTAPQAGYVRPGLLALLVLPLLIGLAACPPRPTPEPGPSQPVSGWTSTARAVLSTLRWALPAARAVTDSILSDPPRTQVARALDAAADASVRLDVALSAYESRGGDRCVAHAAAGGVVVALEQLADVLADNGIALGVVLGRVVDGAASIVDALVPACSADAGWTSAGDVANGRLRLVEDVARRRGIALRRDLDAITEPAR